ncbi:MAG: hypothetical protein SAL07_21665 [Oscillatoria sp. PMC 1051.18]|uniref:hypothetical protein n=1 Tax=Oscillatoria salina TaxID=331517 RepID=UPI0013B6AD42|nr:hypothetical protein [Oscillatoria salina]MBZ8178784.1 hypothetical protein [Oscillatoria salina IIICB1]MEC4894555.1 hypothetical protein [Oscillatoria sp. PMC 1050.18]MEC5032516.1 hypothetical protein [Oscillatoria sp. PMC 1051.18]NET88223.1 hypothetical protein [Kamptonema sp. SIO1D9]
MFKSKCAIAIASLSLLLFVASCSSQSEPEDTTLPGQQHIDKANDAKDTIEQHNKEQEQLPENQE